MVFEFDPVWKDFYPPVSNSEYPISVIDSYPNAQKLHFYDVDIHYNLIRQKLTLSISSSVFEHKYKNKYNISNIRSYPIRLHPTSESLLWAFPILYVVLHFSSAKHYQSRVRTLQLPALSISANIGQA